jgi:tetratricopeptide (TPR) repeat protein
MSTSNPTPDVGKRLRELRLRRGLSQRELAEPRYDGSFVSQIEAGRRSPSREAMSFFAERLAVSVDELMAPLPPSLRVELEIALAEARAAFDAGDMASAREANERLFEIASGGASHEFQAEALHGLGELDERAGRITEALGRYRRAEELAESTELRIRIKLALGRAYRTGGDIAYSIDLLQKALNESLECVWYVGAVRAASLMAMSLTERGDHRRAAEVLESVGGAAAMIDDPRALAALHWMRGRTTAALGHSEDALKHLAAARELYERQQATVEIARLDSARAFTLMELDRHEEAAALYETAIAKLDAAGASGESARLQTELARANLMLGRREDAIRVAEACLERLRTLEDPIEEATCEVVLALALGKDPHAETLLRNAVATCEAHGANEHRARALQALGEYYVMTGRQEEALDAFRRALPDMMPRAGA